MKRNDVGEPETQQETSRVGLHVVIGACAGFLLGTVTAILTLATGFFGPVDWMTGAVGFLIFLPFFFGPLIGGFFGWLVGMIRSRRETAR